MLLHDFTTADGTRILTGGLLGRWEDVLAQFPNPEQLTNELISKKTEHRKLETLGSRFLLYLALGTQVHISYTLEGKPYLNDSNIHISISHSKDYVCVAIHPKHPIGIDLECIGIKMARLRERFLNPQELADLQSDTEHLKAHIYWSGKESIYKVAGQVAVDFRESIHINPFELNESHAHFTAKVGNAEYDLEAWVNEQFVLTTAKAHE